MADTATGSTPGNGDTSSPGAPATGDESTGTGASDTGAADTASADALVAAAIMTEEGRQDPYPLYEQMRNGPRRWRSSLGTFVLSAYDDCLEVLRHPKLGRTESDMPVNGSFSGTRRQRNDENSNVMLFLNPPDHTRIRGLVSRAFTPRRVESLRPRLFELLGEGIGRLAQAGGGDVMAEIARPFPVSVISELLGVPQVDSERIAPLVNDGTRLIDAAADEEAIAKGELAATELAAYFVDLAARKREQPDDGLFSALIEVRTEGDRLSEEELIANTTLLYAAGVDTTSNLIGNGLRLLLANPEQLEILRSDRSLLPSAVWEMLRHDSPVQMNMRAVLEPVEILGMELSRGEMFLVLQGSGNHDEDAYEDSRAFDVTRFSGPDGSVPTPLSFGWGPHHCLGAHLARAEAEIVFGAMLDAFETIELDTAALAAEGNDTGRPHFRESFTIRGLDSLPVRVTAA